MIGSTNDTESIFFKCLSVSFKSILVMFMSVGSAIKKYANLEIHVENITKKYYPKVLQTNKVAGIAGLKHNM